MGKLPNLSHRLKTRKCCSVVTFFLIVSAFLSCGFYKESDSSGSSKFRMERMLPDQDQLEKGRLDVPLISANLSKLIVARRYPRPGDVDCQNFTISLFQENTFNPVGLVSYPGSGNTWLRHLIEFSTGVFTGSVYMDEDLLAKGFLGEKEAWDSGSTVVQKLHLKYSPAYKFPSSILLIREPYPAIISFVHFKESGHLGFAQVSTLHHKKWPDYVLGQTFNWMSLIISWVKSPSKLHIVHYEKLIADTKNELLKICKFLNVPCAYINSACFEKNMDGLFHRKTKIKPPPPAKLEESVLNKIIAGENYISNLLVRHGHDPLPVELYQYHREVFKSR
ncbi:unnamed protein product [Allacma fusca]|uniref:Sulfotransferase domain-containing protein n=1 Tax=Allacma fusca TaxID=39272 RepID=A0A8J2NVR3_9HEXA|nr:unnamed protein product [Allacma fusca]